MLCPLQDPLSDPVAPTVPCADNFCSDDCSSTRRVAPFGVRFDQCSKPWDVVPPVTGQFWEEFTITKILSSDEKNSVSDSVISFAVHNGTGVPVVLKMFTEYHGHGQEVDSLLFEIGVYESMRQLAQAVPHFVTMVASYTYTDPEIAPSPELKSIAKTLHSIAKAKYLAPHEDPKKTLHSHLLLVTMKAPGMSIGDFFSEPRPLEMVISVLFQLMFCLYAMTQMGFQHNDLHSGNVMIDVEPKCSRGIYTLQNQLFVVPMHAHVYIYDFDLSACGICGPNPGLASGSYCTSYGICDARNPRFDMYTILHYLKESACVQAYPQIQLFFQQALGTVPVTEHFQFRMCNETQVATRHHQPPCTNFPRNQPMSVMTPEQLLLTQFELYHVRPRGG